MAEYLVKDVKKKKKKQKRAIKPKTSKDQKTNS